MEQNKDIPLIGIEKFNDTWAVFIKCEYEENMYNVISKGNDKEEALLNAIQNLVKRLSTGAEKISTIISLISDCELPHEDFSPEYVLLNFSEEQTNSIMEDWCEEQKEQEMKPTESSSVWWSGKEFINVYH